MVNCIHFFDSFRQYLTAAEDRSVGLHGTLHVVPDFGCTHVAVSITEAVEPRQGLLGCRGAKGFVGSARLDLPGGIQGRGAAEHDEVQQAV